MEALCKAGSRGSEDSARPNPWGLEMRNDSHIRRSQIVPSRGVSSIKLEFPRRRVAGTDATTGTKNRSHNLA